MKKKNGHYRFYEIIQELEELHSIKNSDYAEQNDPLSNLRMSEEIGIPGFIGNFIRMSDKWARATQLIRKMQIGEAPAVKNESLKDTFRDMAIYCILEMILLEEFEAQKPLDNNG